MEDTIEEVQREVVFAIADTETPGLKVEDGICEIALVEIDPDTLDILYEIDSLIDCQCPIGEVAMGIHGITNEMIADEPTLDEFVEHRLRNRYDGKDLVIIAHNAPFDVARIQPIGNITASICTLFHARQLVPEAPNHKLQTLREHFGFPPNEAHRALADVYTTRRLLRELLGRTNRGLREFLATMDTTVHRMPFGKYRGRLLHELPRDYLLWFKEQWKADPAAVEPNLRKSIEKALKVK